MTELSEILLALITAILALIAYYNNQRTITASTTAVSAKTTADTNTLLALAQMQPATPISDTRARDASGNLTTNQVHGSQYWMDAGYTGPEPDAVTKAAFSDAQAAYDSAVARAIALKAVYGADKLSPAIKEILPK